MSVENSPNIESLRRAKTLRFSCSTAAVTTQCAPQHQPSVLLLTQNIGGIESVTVGDEDEIMSPSVPNVSFSTASRMTVHDDRADLEIDSTVSDEVKIQTLELIGDLRAWLHQAAYAAAQGRALPSTTTTGADSGAHRPGEAVVKRSRRAVPPLPTPAVGAPSATASAAESVLDPYTVTATPPQIDVVVLHLQEIGGKYANAAFTSFFAEQVQRHLLPECGWCSGLMTDFPGDHNKFTAIGTVVFVSPRMRPITSVLVLPHRSYIPVSDDPASYGGQATRTFHSAKFAKAGNSRKGFVFTSLRLGTTLLHCCNLHLFNDVSNAIALQGAPSVYAQRRADAFLEATAECLTLAGKDDPIFFFGDMNLRLDGKAVATYAKSTLQVDLVAEAKSLRAPDAFWRLFDNTTTVRTVLSDTCDVEPRQLMDRVAREVHMELAEMPLRFAPTYLRIAQPYRERWRPQYGHGVAGIPPPQARLPSLLATRTGRPYDQKRLPAWCDRILFNPAALELVAGGCGLPASGVKEGAEKDPTARSPVHYLYDAVHLCHTDHDGVFLLF